MRTFRLDRVMALYKGSRQIDDPMMYLAERFGGLAPEPVDTERLAMEALGVEPDVEYTPLPESAAKTNYAPDSSPFSEIADIPTAKKMFRKRFVLALVFFTLGIAALETMILSLASFGLATFLFFQCKNIKKRIKVLEAERGSRER